MYSASNSDDTLKKRHVANSSSVIPALLREFQPIDTEGKNNSSTSSSVVRKGSGKRVLSKLLEEGDEELEGQSSDDDLPYRGKVYLARRKKPDSWPCIAFQVNLLFSRSVVDFS